MEFKNLKTAVAKQFKHMSAETLFRTAIAPDYIWQKYLASFPTGSNPIYKTRTEHDCSCCRSFVRLVGGVVTVARGEVQTIWDNITDVDPAYQAVAAEMAMFVRLASIDNLFLHYEPVAGTAVTRNLLEDKTVQTWEHFFVNLPPSAFAKKDEIGTKGGNLRATHDVMLRGLSEITQDAVDTVLELISQGSLYRGEENRFAVEKFQQLQLRFSATAKKDLFVWGNLDQPESVTRIRNTAIGTLLVDLSADMELDDAVKSFESKVAPTNYKRPTALVSKAMVKRAQETINALGLTSALDRRYATIDDITVNNILFADRAARKEMNVFDEIASVLPQAKTFGKVEEVGIDTFISEILPQAQAIEVLFENRHAVRLVSLIAPVDPTAKEIFKWDNNFSWSYAGDVADSIKERVKRAGGQIEAALRCSLSWFNYDDLDLHVTEPDGNEIYYGHKLSSTGGQLDVDMNAGSGSTRSAVENIFWPNKERILPGVHALVVNNFCARETNDVGFDAEIEFDGQIHSFAYRTRVGNKENVIVAKFSYSAKEGFKILDSIPGTQVAKQLWGLTTQTFQRVKIIMLSPNHWDDKGVGNRHFFFMLEGCKHEGKARGFYNEFLGQQLSEHRKVLEIVGAKMRTEESDRQLSGIGFSSTQRDSVTVRVTGQFSRVVKVIF
jgi:hypothetical protein